MKNLKYLVFGLLSMFVVTANVDAISQESDLLTCLNGTEEVCTLSGSFATTSEITLNSNRKVTIDLGNNTLTLGGRINVSDGASLTVKGSGEVVTSATSYMFNVTYGSSLVLESGKYTNNKNSGIVVALTGSSTDSTTLLKTYLDVKKDATLIGNYGILIRHAGNNAAYGVEVDFSGKIENITGNNGYNYGTIGITTNGNIKATNGNIPVINITGGSIKTVEGTTGNVNDDDAPAIYAAGYAKWNISGGTIEGSEALGIKSGEFNITGGTLKAFGSYSNPAEHYGNGSEATGAAISVTGSTGYENSVKLSIANSTVISKKGNAIYEGISIDSNGNPSIPSSPIVDNGIKIASGTFESAEGKKSIDISTDEKNFISGGEFSTEIDKNLLATNLSSSKQEDGTYLVGEKHKVTVSENENGKVSVDKTEAIAGETVKITVTPNDGYKVKSVTANDEEVKDNKFIMPNKDVKVEVTFEKVESAPVNVDSNPKTGDGILAYGIIGLIALLGLGYTLKQKRTN